MNSWAERLMSMISLLERLVRQKHQQTSAGMNVEQEQELRAQYRAHDLKQAQILEDFLKNLK
ncbi:hypothetical protein [Roseibium marinum]|uniref:Uncharacterized protein n=1 Tax=Roseibium marinum TaxID=281252 RepID=A0A2S3V2Y8_9HYPH|nr:hypothetical protein [Roseibium marinum]POF34344.1 hypothetical protein CLV41_101798 [Roseibium marinum]